ncbi:MAG: hypothetical protein H8E98_05850 [Bacteroidetes bacterium]|nr:hypothetical protein [Bacteroidota bacterium]MBL6963929.1 hypothetical protein [Bacteroidota bacterium]
MIEYGLELFVLFLFPIIGILLDSYLSKRMTIYILIGAIILLLPILTNYNYIIPAMYQFLALIALACIYSFFSKRIKLKSRKIRTATVISTSLFIILGFLAFVDAFAGGIQKVEKHWKVDGYRVEYIQQQGYKNRHELKKYGQIPIFIKKIDATFEFDTVQSCYIHFINSKIDFDQCTGTLIKDNNIP